MSAVTILYGYFQVILFDIGSASHKMSEMKQELFEKAGIGIPHEDIETNDVAIFGYVNTSFIFYFSECEGECPPFFGWFDL